MINDRVAAKGRADRLATWEDGAEVLAKVLTGGIDCNAR